MRIQISLFFFYFKIYLTCACKWDTACNVAIQPN